MVKKIQCLGVRNIVLRCHSLKIAHLGLVIDMIRIDLTLGLFDYVSSRAVVAVEAAAAAIGTSRKACKGAILP